MSKSKRAKNPLPLNRLIKGAIRLVKRGGNTVVQFAPEKPKARKKKR